MWPFGTVRNGLPTHLYSYLTAADDIGVAAMLVTLLVYLKNLNSRLIIYHITLHSHTLMPIVG